jgi:predicted enzyme related to lactoylglutathione lyase
MKLFFNLFCHDVDSQLAFYQSLLGLAEHQASHSPIYRSLHTEDFHIGFHAQPAYALLNLADRAPRHEGTAPVTGYATFMLESPAAVDAATARVVELGGRVVKGPYPTYYGQWQAVVCDPELHVFRLSVETLPPGVTAPELALRTPERPS